MAIPSFMVVGAQKAGTTWLFECLDEHPEVFVPRVKEVHFFDRPEDSRFSQRHRGLDWYLEQFSDDPAFRARGELTPDYMYYPHVAAELHALNPDLRIVFMLRNPVDRAYSAYWMRRRHDAGLADFAALADPASGYVARGFYARQIAPYMERFPREQLRIYIYEEAVRDPELFVADLYGFLGVDAGFRPKTLTRRVGATHRLPKGLGFFVYKIVSPVINLPVILPAWRWLRRNTRVVDIALDTVAKPGATNYPPLSDDERRRLAAVFADENARLFGLIGRDVPAWRG